MLGNVPYVTQKSITVSWGLIQSSSIEVHKLSNVPFVTKYVFAKALNVADKKQSGSKQQLLLNKLILLIELPQWLLPTSRMTLFICDCRIQKYGSHMQVGMRPDDPIGQHWLPLRYYIITWFTIWNVWHIKSAKIDLPLIIITIF